MKPYNKSNKMIIKNKDLVNVLRNANKSTDFISRLKIIYRPYICPFNHLLHHIDDTKSIYDIGCGSGQFLLLLATFKKPQKLGGIDIDEALINNAQNLLSQFNNFPVAVHTYDGEHIPENIENYDYVTLIDILHHLPYKNQLSFLIKIYQKMKPGSVLIYKDIDRSSPLVFGNKIHDLVLSRSLSKEISFKKAKKHLKDAGFEIINEYRKNMLWYPHFILIAKK
jgi:2-polyprenyl-3-methyl-5-hydroxy-6-metoxy-1,4-benzoquinol methylase